MTATGPSSSPVAAARTIAIVAPLLTELRGVIDRLGLAREGRYYVGTSRTACRVVAATVGAGRDPATDAVVRLIDDVRPDAMAVVGFAGGLDPRLRPGETLRFRSVIDEQGQGFSLWDGEIPQNLNCDFETMTQPALVTVDRIITSTREKAHLLATLAAAAVEMESCHIASVAQQHRVRLTVIRAISDPATTALPSESTRWISRNGKTRYGAVLGYLARRPWELPTLVRLGRYAQAARMSLAVEVERWLSEIG